MKINFKSCTEEKLWKYIATHLSQNGFDAVLVCGAVVSIYTKGLYQSGDLDFIISNLIQDKLPSVMKDIGFIQNGRHYTHPECQHLFVEFPPGPLGIGDEYDIRPKKVKIAGATIKILSPTDCVKDRLASYLYFRAKDCLEQAVLVAKSQPVSFQRIKRWCEQEGSADTYKEFYQLYKTFSL